MKNYHLKTRKSIVVNARILKMFEYICSIICYASFVKIHITPYLKTIYPIIEGAWTSPAEINPITYDRNLQNGNFINHNRTKAI